jgi:hypothetical protein
MFSYFAVVHDPRRQHPTTFHSLEALIIITILATICGAHNWVEIEQWGHAQKSWLSQFLALPHGIPSHDTFGHVFCLLGGRRPHRPVVPQGPMSWRSGSKAPGRLLSNTFGHFDYTGSYRVFSRTMLSKLVSSFVCWRTSSW